MTSALDNVAIALAVLGALPPDGDPLIASSVAFRAIASAMYAPDRSDILETDILALKRELEGLSAKIEESCQGAVLDNRICFGTGLAIGVLSRLGNSSADARPDITADGHDYLLLFANELERLHIRRRIDDRGNQLLKFAVMAAAVEDTERRPLTPN